MSLTLLNKFGRQEIAMEPFQRRRKPRSRPCNVCGKWIFVRGRTPVKHHYCIEHLAVPFTEVVLNDTIHNSSKVDY